MTGMCIEIIATKTGHTNQTGFTSRIRRAASVWNRIQVIKISAFISGILRSSASTHPYWLFLCKRDLLHGRNWLLGGAIEPNQVKVDPYRLQLHCSHRYTSTKNAHSQSGAIETLREYVCVYDCTYGIGESNGKGTELASAIKYTNNSYRIDFHEPISNSLGVVTDDVVVADWLIEIDTL